MIYFLVIDIKNVDFMDMHNCDIFTGERVSLHSKGMFFWVFIIIIYAVSFTYSLQKCILIDHVI